LKQYRRGDAGSAVLDGVKRFPVLVSIALPLSKAILSVIALYYAVAAQERLLHRAFVHPQPAIGAPAAGTPGNLVIADDSTIASSKIGFGDALMYVGKHALRRDHLVSTLPLLIIYPFIQKYFRERCYAGCIERITNPCRGEFYYDRAVQAVPHCEKCITSMAEADRHRQNAAHLALGRVPHAPARGGRGPRIHLRARARQISYLDAGRALRARYPMLKEAIVLHDDEAPSRRRSIGIAAAQYVNDILVPDAGDRPQRGKTISEFASHLSPQSLPMSRWRS
jgi:hypothetical protein